MTLRQSSAATMTWSRKRRPTSAAAVRRRVVASKSARLGAGEPPGWLWAMAKATPSCRSVRDNASRRGRGLPVAPPRARGRTCRRRLPPSSTNSSTSSVRALPMRADAIRAMSADSRITAGVEDPTRLARPKAATRRAAFALPMPG